MFSVYNQHKKCQLFRLNIYGLVERNKRFFSNSIGRFLTSQIERKTLRLGSIRLINEQIRLNSIIKRVNIYVQSWLVK